MNALWYNPKTGKTGQSLPEITGLNGNDGCYEISTTPICKAVDVPDDCQSTKDGVCNLPIGSCKQCQGTASPVQADGWISVEDRLPENRPGWSHSETVNILSMKDGHEFVSTGAYNYLQDKWADFLHGDEYIGFITNWQPLPKSPRRIETIKTD